MNKKKPIPLFINASHPFPLKVRCKHCGSNEMVYYQDYCNPYQYPNTRYARDRGLASFEGWMKYTDTDFLISYFRREGYRIDPARSVAFKRYAPKFSRSWSGVQDQNRPFVSNMVVVVVCKNCDLQTWVYMNSNVRKMPENFNRKARIDCPTKIMSLIYKSKRR